MRRREFNVGLGLSVLAATVRAQPAARAVRYEGRLFDGHLHLNWENGFRFPVAEAFALMRANGVTTILATSRPNDGTHALVDAATQGGPGKATSILVYKVYYDGFKAMDLGGSAKTIDIADAVVKNLKSE